MTEITAIKPGLTTLAISLLNVAVNQETKPDLAVDIFKAVALYHLGTMRTAKSKKDTGGDGETFETILTRTRADKHNGATQ